MLIRRIASIKDGDVGGGGRTHARQGGEEQSGTAVPRAWLVGSQVAAGTCLANASSGCYWERRRNFAGTLSGIISNNFVSSAGQQLMSISAGDTGFFGNADCGTWTRISSVTAELTAKLTTQSSASDVRRLNAEHAEKSLGISSQRSPRPLR